MTQPVEVPMIPARYQQIVFSQVPSGMMSFIPSGVSTFRALGPAEGFIGLWLASWEPSRAIARRAVVALVRPDSPVAESAADRAVQR
jgi:hypothetical protein